MIIVHSKAREMKDRRRADGVVIKNSAKVLTTHGPKSTELFLGKVKTYLVFLKDLVSIFLKLEHSFMS